MYELQMKEAEPRRASRRLIEAGYRDMDRPSIDYYIRLAEETRTRELHQMVKSCVKAMRQLWRSMLARRLQGRRTARLPRLPASA